MLNTKRKFVSLASAIAIVVSLGVLTSCGSQENDFSRSKKLVTEFCQGWWKDYKKADLKPLAEAARLEPQWLPLAKSAALWNAWESGDKVARNETYANLISEAYAQIYGVCNGA